ncbi:GspMb/PilO family protein [Pontiella agarivorans]|uniref:GspMb/PilO family protein n=1 Tax=Pontiella agarivorans TaxID=3038953 RepID=A0ABU5MWK1_9BACT|nr:GspMb/PilO family protein [Pontiella agarivorans]MDZ8118559.1 GspMb/PilO family protein [Pontiella agarivorans]
MKNPLAKLSRRERLYVLAGGTVLLFGLVLYPIGKKAAAFREEQLELLQEEAALLEDLYVLELDGWAIEEEHEKLKSALREADDLLFPPIENRILTQTAMIKLLNELGPDLELETTAGRSSVGDAANQLNLELRGEGRYPEILKFIHRLETYRPLILVQDFSLAERRTRRRRRDQSTDTAEPRLSLNMSIQIICQAGGEK